MPGRTYILRFRCMLVRTIIPVLTELPLLQAVEGLTTVEGRTFGVGWQGRQNNVTVWVKVKCGLVAST